MGGVTDPELESSWLCLVTNLTIDIEERFVPHPVWKKKEEEVLSL